MWERLQFEQRFLFLPPNKVWYPLTVVFHRCSGCPCDSGWPGGWSWPCWEKRRRTLYHRWRRGLVVWGYAGTLVNWLMLVIYSIDWCSWFIDWSLIMRITWLLSIYHRRQRGCSELEPGLLLNLTDLLLTTFSYPLTRMRWGGQTNFDETNKTKKEIDLLLTAFSYLLILARWDIQQNIKQPKAQKHRTNNLFDYEKKSTNKNQPSN